MRDSFVFYKSFYEAVKKLPDGFQLDFYNALTEYMFNDNIIEMPPVVEAMFLLVKPAVESACRRYDASVENGKKGGRPKKPNNNLNKPNNNLKKPNNNLDITQTKPNNNLTETKVKPNQNPYVYDNVYVYDNDNVYVNDNVEVDAKKQPTVVDITLYITQHHLNVDAKKFYDYYKASNWKDKQGNTINWQQKLQTWNNFTPKKVESENGISNKYHETDDKYGDFEQYYTIGGAYSDD